MKVEDLLARNKNNMDLLRLILALLVIYGHGFTLFNSDGNFDYIKEFLIFDHSGSMAVKAFFFFSGLVVTNSLLSKNDSLQFIIARFFRIWPGLLVLLILTIFVGSLITTETVGGYFTKETFNYFYKNALLNTKYTLPGVFYDNKFPNVVNGSLWSVFYEVKAYCFLFAFYLLRGFRQKYIPLTCFLLLTIFTALFPYENPELQMLWPCFSLGAIFAFYKKKIVISGLGSIFLLVLFLLFKESFLSEYLFYAFLCYTLLFLSSRKWILKIRPKWDISYGVYLWGFFVQQLIFLLCPQNSFVLNLSMSFAVSIMLGALSWFVVEDRFINIGRVLLKKIQAASPSVITFY